MPFESFWRPIHAGRALLPFAVVASLGAPVRAEEPVHLPTLPEYDRAAVRDLNDLGRAVGQAFRSDLALPRRAVVWKTRPKHSASVEALPTLQNFVDADAAAISRSGIPVGTSSLRLGSFTFFRAVLWKKKRGEWQAIELEPPPGYTDTIAADVNSRGVVVGWAFNPGEVVDGDVVRRAVVWLPHRHGSHTVVELERPEGFQSTATSINERGDVAGTAYRTEVVDTELVQRSDVLVWGRVAGHLGHHGFRSKHGRCRRSPEVLRSLPGLPTNRVPTINLFGHVVAAAEVLANGNFFTRPAFWKRRHSRKRGTAYSKPEELPIPEGFTDASAVDMSATGKVVGTASVRQGRILLSSAAVKWTHRRKGGWKEEVVDSPEGSTFVSAAQISDLGSVVGNDLRPAAGVSGALRWKPAWSWFDCWRW